jgi:hypothetical protein
VDGRVPATGRACEIRVHRNTWREVKVCEAQPQPDRPCSGDASGAEGVSKSSWVFPGYSLDAPILGTSLDHQHQELRDDTLKWSKEFVVHSLRHTMLTRLGEAGADAFTIMKIAAHSSVTVSQRYVHPPEGIERAFERLQELNSTKAEEARSEEAKVEAAGAGGASEVPTISSTVKKRQSPNVTQVVGFKSTGP